MRRWLVRSVAALVLLVGVLVAGTYVYLRRSLPLVDGSVTVAGINAPLDIVRDADGIPHILAANKLDAFFGLGYVHAQDRLWQMEFQRRIGFGRLSEIFGAVTLPQDRFLRTVGFGRAARSAWDHAPDRVKEQVNAYLGGVNAFIATHHGSQLPPEFTLLGFEPEPWTGPDVAVWVKMMSWDLSANYSFELLRDDLARAVGDGPMAALMPPYATNGLSIMPGTPDEGSQGSPGSQGSVGSTGLQGSATSRTSGDSFSSFVRALSEGEPSVSRFLLGGSRVEALGSNNWVIDGTMSATGKPMLANDPHLSAKTPSTWYLAHISGGSFDAIGSTLPGTPAIAIGRNRFIAWGMTNVAADVEDLYRERLDPTGRFAEFQGAQEPIATIAETIAVKNASPVQVTVRVTRHGPLVSDALNAINADSKKTPKPAPLEPLAFRWTALDPDDSTLESFAKLNEATNWDEFRAALRGYVSPSQNFVYGDVNGHIGYYAPGHIPVRASGDGSRPANGWTGDAEWTGWVPFDELPHLYDPPQHFIVTANHRPAPASYPHLLGVDWVEPYRAKRIVDLLSQKASFSVDDFARIQADTVSLHATELLPILMRHARPTTDLDRLAVDVLRQWNLNASADSAGSAIFSAWFHHLAPAMVGDELGPLALDSYAGRFTYITRFVERTLESSDSKWCDDVTTPTTETCEDTVTRALHDGVAELAAAMGSDVGRWRWDAVHIATFPHQGLDTVRALRPLLSRSMPNGGDWSTVNVGAVAADHAYEQHAVPGYRQIVDLSPANDSRFLDAVGESGHPLSRHYDDFLKDWQAVRHKKMRMERGDIENGATGTLTLKPSK